MATINPVLAATLVAALLLAGGCSHESSGPAEGIGIVADDHGIIRVPESSALRKRLAVQAVDVKDSPHALVIPADVEADPRMRSGRRRVSSW
jgi:membrane fusion protein, heavy metal efflux system